MLKLKQSKVLTASVMAVAVSLFAAIPAKAVEYTFTDLGSFSGGWKWPNDINASGQVVGYYTSTSTGGRFQHGFLYSGGVMQDVVSLDGTGGAAYGINTSGQIVGCTSFTGNSPGHAFLYTNGTMQDLGTLGGSYSIAYDINDHGQIVGSSQVTGDASSHPFLYSNGVMQDLGTLDGIGGYVNDMSINANGQVVGTWYLPSYTYVVGPDYSHAFIYSDGVMRPLGTLGGSFSAARDINDHGQVVGDSTITGNGTSHAFLCSDGAMQDLGTLGGSYSGAWGINNLGQVVGGSYTADGSFRAFLYSDGQMTDLNTLLPASSGWTLDRATAINDAGQIVGMAYPDGSYQSHIFLLTPVPEPGTLLLTAIAAVGILSKRRRC